MKKKLYVWVMSVLCLFMTFSRQQYGKAEVIHETDLEEYILKEMSEAHVMSMGVSIVSPGREVYCASYGAETKTDRDYVLGELTQSFTAAAVMHLAEDGELSLDDVVGRYLKDEKYQAVSGVTIRELLHQTSGISVYETMSEISGSGTRGQFEAAPVNYNILGAIIEKISGVSYEEYIADNILDPLEMKSTHSLRNNVDFGSEMVPGYRYYFRFPFETNNDYDEDDDWRQVSSSLMISDVKDMGKYLQMYLQDGGEILSGDTVSSMLKGTVPVNYDTNYSKRLFDSSTLYGMGWMSAKLAGKQVYYCTGKSDNSTTGMFLLPEKKLGVAILFNSADHSGQGFLEKLEKGIISIELEEPAEEFTSGNYFQRNIMLDIGIVLLILVAWLPIFLISVWGNRRRRRMLNVFGILLDVCIHLVLPTLLLLKVQSEIPLFFLQKLYPDNYYTVLVLIGSLYLGALIKIIATIVFAILGPKPEEDVTEQTEETTEASALEEAAASSESRSVEQTQNAEKKPVSKKDAGKTKETVKKDVDVKTPVMETIVQKSTIKEVKPLADSTKEIELKIPPVKREKNIQVSAKTVETKLSEGKISEKKTKPIKAETEGKKTLGKAKKEETDGKKKDRTKNTGEKKHK